MSKAELAALPPAEKWKVLEFLWESLRPELDSLPVPAEHQKLLDERRTRTKKGTSEPVSWDNLKAL
jgi:putative addiction module component (TIGR02574 family)